VTRYPGQGLCLSANPPAFVDKVVAKAEGKEEKEQDARAGAELFLPRRFAKSLKS